MVTALDHTRLVPGSNGEEVPMPQPRDAVRFKLGTRPIELNTITDRDSGMVSIVVDGVEVVTMPPDIADHHYRTALETARRIGLREV